MTTKWKIIVGFVVMILLIGAVSVIGYRSLSGATESFGEYGRLSHLNVRTSDMLARQQESIAAVRLFRISGDRKLMEQANSIISNNTAIVKEARTYAQRKDILDVLDAAERSAAEQTQLIGQMEKGLLALRSEFADVTQPAALALGEALAEMNNEAFVNGNLGAASASVAAVNALGHLRSAFGIFAYRPSPEDGNRVDEALAGLTKAVNDLGASLSAGSDRAVFEKAQKLHGDLARTAGVLRDLGSGLDKSNAALMALNADLGANIAKISSLADEMMTQQEASTVEQNASSQSFMLIVASAGLILGILLAVLIIAGLVRVLHNLSVFAGAIAQGDFQARVNSREKGEVGAMLSAMRQIPQVLENLINVVRSESGKILVGDYRTRLDTAAFSGSFTALAASINLVCEAYTKIMDIIPLALFTGNTDRKILYANALTQKILGGENRGQSCGACFNTDFCSTGECFAVRAMQSKHNAVGEVAIRPATGVNLEISVIALPLLDENGVARGYIEVCNDITESNQRQLAMKRVSEQAASISSRVAAASEQLSAQVEQVSRGADMQRSRVEGTASAMTEMNSTVLEVARNAGQASEQSELTRNKANDGASLVGNVVQSINTVNSVAGNLQTNMQELGAQAESIGGVMNVISDIADQTNLLALNAAIEAARAGDAGRGFAVVADEVRKLAEKTMSATQEVGAKILAIQTSARTNINEVNEAARAITEATELANTSGRALAEIVDLASSNSAVVTSIATAAEEQSATSEEINRAIEEISRIVGETSEGMVQSSSAVQELSRMAQELNSVIDQLK